MRVSRCPVRVALRTAGHAVSRAALAATVVFTLPVPALVAQGLPTAAPSEVGMDAGALARIGPAMQDFIDQGRTAGVMTMVARRGRVVHWDARGWAVLGEDPLERDDVFRIYSMTKPVTSVAVMMLVEEGRLSLDTEVGAVLPAFGDVAVYVDADTRRLPDRPITIRDLLSHTAGLTYGLFGDTPVDSLYLATAPYDIVNGRDLEETTDALAALPLVDDPGDLWNYSMATDVLGRVVEVVSGMPLEAFFEERIFAPLGMEDTAFHVQEDDLDRFTAVHSPGPDGLTVIDPTSGPFTRPPSWPSGGGGLVSDASDYVRFTQMLLNGGELDGMRILEEETVRAMRTNVLPDELMPIGVLGGPDTGFGLGFAVETGEGAGTYWWLGAASTHFWIDPVEELVMFVWTQYQPVAGSGVHLAFPQLVYDALVESNR